jgi:hypothetical protein
MVLLAAVAVVMSHRWRGTVRLIRQRAGMFADGIRLHAGVSQ